MKKLPPVQIRRVWIEEARSNGPRAKWRPVKDGVARLRFLRVWIGDGDPR